MKTKTLNTIQKISKIVGIIAKIVFILCIVGGAFCVVGIIGLAVIPDGGFKLGGMTIKGLIDSSEELSLGTAYTGMAMGIIYCAGEAVLAKFAETYFEHEQAAGTPFNFDGAKELMRLGILTICIPIGTAIVAGIVYGIMSIGFNNVGNIDMSNSFSIGLGLMFIFLSLICKYGAEISQNHENETAKAE